MQSKAYLKKFISNMLKKKMCKRETFFSTGRHISCRNILHDYSIRYKNVVLWWID